MKSIVIELVHHEDIGKLLPFIKEGVKGRAIVKEQMAAPTTFLLELFEND